MFSPKIVPCMLMKMNVRPWRLVFVRKTSQNWWQKKVINSRQKNLLIIATFSAAISVLLFPPRVSLDLLRLLMLCHLLFAIDFLHVFLLHWRTPIIINWQRLFHHFRLKSDIYHKLFVMLAVFCHEADKEIWNEIRLELWFRFWWGNSMGVGIKMRGLSKDKHQFGICRLRKQTFPIIWIQLKLDIWWRK